MAPPKPTPEVKAILSEWVRIQRERHGENWKEIVAKDMAAKTAPTLERLMTVLRSGAKK